MRRLLALAALLAGCNPDFTPQYLVDDLRILGIRAEAPPGSLFADAEVGDAIRLSALVANPRGRAPVVYRWYACAPAADEGVPACLDPAVLRHPERLGGTPGVIRLGEGVDLERLELAAPDVAAALEHVVALARAEPAYQCRLYAEAPVVLVVEAGGRREVAVKSVRFRAPSEVVTEAGLEDLYVRNVNPEVHALRLHPTLDEGCDGLDVRVGCDADAECDGARCVRPEDGGRGICALPGAALPAGRMDLCAWPDWRRIQRYSVCAPDGVGETSETPSWQWYLTGGAIDDASAVGNATGERITLDRPDGPFTLWVIVRDGRGGEGWLRADFPAAR